jgi:hypothetical protein
MMQMQMQMHREQQCSDAGPVFWPVFFLKIKEKKNGDYYYYNSIKAVSFRIIDPYMHMQSPESSSIVYKVGLMHPQLHCTTVL